MTFRLFSTQRYQARSLEFARFLAVGSVNTVVGYGVFLLTLPTVGYQPAYALAYLVGIIVAYVLNSTFVFRSRIALRTALKYPLVYVAQYLFGALLLYGMVAWLGIDRRWAALIALMLSVPVSFLLNRLALAKRARDT